MFNKFKTKCNINNPERQQFMGFEQRLEYKLIIVSQHYYLSLVFVEGID